MNEKTTKSSSFNGLYDSTELDVSDIHKSHDSADVAIADLHSRVRDMLSNGVEIPFILSVISADKHCTDEQKKEILSEIHLSEGV